MSNFVKNLKKGQDLSFEESKTLFNELMEGKYDENSIIEILEFSFSTMLLSNSIVSFGELGSFGINTFALIFLDKNCEKILALVDSGELLKP